MKFAIVVVLLAVVVGAYSQTASISASASADPQIAQLEKTLTGAVGPKIAALVIKILETLKKLKPLAAASPAIAGLVNRFLDPDTGIVNKILFAGNKQLTQAQKADEAKLKEELTTVVGENTAGFIARTVVLAKAGLLKELKLGKLGNLVNLVVCVVKIPGIQKVIEPVEKILRGLLSGAPLSGLKGTLGGLKGAISGLLKGNVAENLGAALKGVLGGVTKCIKGSGLGGLLG